MRKSWCGSSVYNCTWNEGEQRYIGTIDTFKFPLVISMINWFQIMNFSETGGYEETTSAEEKNHT